MNIQLKYQLAKLLLPSHGYFGGGKIVRLIVPVDHVIDLVQIEIQSGHANFLNLSSINFLDHTGKKIDLTNVCQSARLTSSFADGSSVDVLDHLANNRAIHSALERTPRLTIIFKKPLKVGCIEIANRSDIYGERARHLVLTAWNGQTEILRHINSDQNSLLGMLDDLLTKTGLPTEFELEGQNQVYLKASELQDAIASRLKCGDLELQLAQTLALLPIYTKEPIVNENILIFMGDAIAKILAKETQIHTADLREFQHILADPRRIECASKYASAALRRSTKYDLGLVFGKHNIGFSNLLTKKEEYKKVIHIVCKQLSDWSIESVICYGTLLGAVRDKGFIPHDDDVDVLYFDSSKNREEMMRNREVVLKKFRDNGYGIWDSGTNFQVSPSGYTVGIDLFPCWTEGDHTSLMMEKYLYRTIPTDILRPVGSIKLYGETYPAPNNPEAFLKERYGHGWSISNPYHEWPWNIDNPDDWPRRQSPRALNAKRTIMIAWGQHVVTELGIPPKNSPSMIEKALELNYDAVEIDIRLSSDGVFVLGHDDVILGEDNSKIRISNTPASKLLTFSLGMYDGQPNTIISLTDALKMMGDNIVHLDPRIPPEDIKTLRKTIDEVKFDAGKIIFCGYGDSAIKELIVHFPESAILYKYYGSLCAIDDFVLDELKRKQVDGLMLFWPLHYEDSSDFMKRLKKRDLQVLFYVHGSWPSRGEVDNTEKSLRKMINNEVDYITSTASNVDAFKRLVSTDY